MAEVVEALLSAPVNAVLLVAGLAFLRSRSSGASRTGWMPDRRGACSPT
jgi:hypothetical protein